MMSLRSNNRTGMSLAGRLRIQRLLWLFDSVDES